MKAKHIRINETYLINDNEPSRADGDIYLCRVKAHIRRGRWLVDVIRDAGGFGCANDVQQSSWNFLRPMTLDEWKDEVEAPFPKRVIDGIYEHANRRGGFVELDLTSIEIISANGDRTTIEDIISTREEET